MRLDAVLEAARQREAHENTTAVKLCLIIGCHDVRTAGMHLARITKAAAELSRSLAERQAMMVHLQEHESTGTLRPHGTFERLDELYRRQKEAQVRAGAHRRAPASVGQLLQAMLGKRGGKVSTSSVPRPPPECDTPP